MPRQRQLALLVSLLVSAFALFLLFRQVNLSDLVEQIRHAKLGYLLLLAIIYPLAMLIRAYRWGKLLASPLPYWRSFHIVNIAYLFNAVLPFRLGEVVRILLMSREPQHTAGEALSATTLERLFDLMLALLCVGAGLVLLPDSSPLPRSTVHSIGILIIVTIIGLSMVLFAPPMHPFLLKSVQLISRPLPFGAKVVQFAQDTLASLKSLSSLPRLATILGWSLVTWASYIAFFYVGLYSFFDNPPLSVGVLVTGFTALGIAAPSLPGAIGVFQAASVLALRTAGYDTTIATSYAWTLWLAQTGAVVLVGMGGLYALSLSFTQLSQEVQTTANDQ